VILGVSVDSTASHQQFCTKDSLTFRLLSDTDHTVVSAYGSLGGRNGVFMANRNTFLINPKGKVVKVWTKVNRRPAHRMCLPSFPIRGTRSNLRPRARLVSLASAQAGAAGSHNRN